MSPQPGAVLIREVGPRDGLQPERPLSVDDRVRFIETLLDAGVTSIEAVAFVSPRAVPAMAQAAEVVAGLSTRTGVRLAALVPNRRGAELALEAGGVDELTFTISISETYNQRNVGRSVDESLSEFEVVTDLELPVDAVVSCAFGSPYEGDVSPQAVASFVEDLRARGAASVTLADTTGMATPRRIAEVLGAAGTDFGLHLHETRGTGLVNAYAAWQHGVGRFDSSVGGLGGSPFADGAAGNVATEGLVALFDDLGVTTGIDVEGLCSAAQLVAELVGHGVPSPVASAGPRSRLAGTG